LVEQLLDPLPHAIAPGPDDHAAAHARFLGEIRLGNDGLVPGGEILLAGDVKGMLHGGNLPLAGIVAGHSHSLPPSRAYAVPPSTARRRASTPLEAKAAAQRASAGVSNSKVSVAGLRNQPCRIISFSSCPAPQPA